MTSSDTGTNLRIDESETTILSNTEIINLSDDAFIVEPPDPGNPSDNPNNQVNIFFEYPIRADGLPGTTGVSNAANVRELELGDGLSMDLSTRPVGEGLLGILSSTTNLTVEGNDSSGGSNVEFENVNRIDFGHDDFFVSTTSTTGEILVTSRGGSGGGFLLQEDGNAEVATVQELNFGNGFTVIPNEPSPADATSAEIIIDTSSLPQHRSYEFDKMTPNNSLGDTTSSAYSLTEPSTGVFQLLLSNIGTFSQDQPPIIQVYERPSRTPGQFGSPPPRTMILPMEVTITAAGTIRITFSQDIQGTVVANGIDLT